MERRWKGLTPQEVYSHVQGMHSLGAKTGYLWKMLGRKRLYTVNTEASILETLKSLYSMEGESFRCEDEQKRHEVYLDFARGLQQHGYPKSAAATVEEIKEGYAAALRHSQPQERQYHRYSTQRSFYGCGYEDSTEVYGGFDEEGYRAAWKRWEEKDSKARQFLSSIQSAAAGASAGPSYEHKFMLPPFGSEQAELIEHPEHEAVLQRMRQMKYADSLYFWSAQEDATVQKYIAKLESQFAFARLPEVYEECADLHKEAYRGWRRERDKSASSDYHARKVAAEDAGQLFWWGRSREIPEGSKLREHYDKYAALIGQYRSVLEPRLDQLAKEGKYWTAKRLARRRVEALEGKLEEL